MGAGDKVLMFEISKVNHLFQSPSQPPLIQMKSRFFYEARLRLGYGGELRVGC
jgi:hypothetical protein